MALEPGGYADKLGNRYEGLWVVHQLLMLLEERVRAVTVEAIGDDEAGVDLWVECRDDRRDAQQCKCENGAKSSWTIADLHGRGILHHARTQLERDSRYQFTLVTAVPATQLADLSRSARDSDGEPEHFFRFQVEELSAGRREAFRSYCRHLGMDAANPSDRTIAFDLLMRTHVHLFSDDEQTRENLRVFAIHSVAGEPDIVISVLAAFAECNLRRRIIASDVVSHLQSLSLQIQRLALDPRISLALCKLQDSFEESIAPKLVTGSLIPRSETDELLTLLDTSPVPAIVVLHGGPGLGKSGVLLQFISELQNREIPVLAVRLDRSTLRANTDEFGRQLGLPASPVRCLAELSGDRQSVLVLDQLDALRWTSAHALEGLEVCKSMMREVRGYRNLGYPITLVICCRTFDLRHDPQISEWLTSSSSPDMDKFVKIEVRALPKELVCKVIRSVGVDPDRMTNRSLSLLATIQNLALWTTLIRRGERSPDFDSATALMREFWQSQRQQIETAGIPADERDAAIDRLVDYMECHSSQSAPRSLIEKHRRLSTELQSTGVLTLSSTSVTFGHQSHLDFLIAERVTRDLDAAPETALGWLGDIERQTLFRREQLRQALFLLADERPIDFVGTISRVLHSKQVRFHIKQLAIETLGQVDPQAASVDLAGRGGPPSARPQTGTLRHFVQRRPEWL